MSAYLQAAEAIQTAFDCVVIIIHRCGHDGNHPRGHSSQIGAADAQISVKKDEAGHGRPVQSLDLVLMGRRITELSRDELLTLYAMFELVGEVAAEQRQPRRPFTKCPGLRSAPQVHAWLG